MPVQNLKPTNPKKILFPDAKNSCMNKTTANLESEERSNEQITAICYSTWRKNKA
jgi:hypothetical protein